jgi:hypothetical protein
MGGFDEPAITTYGFNLKLPPPVTDANSAE